MYTLTRSLAVFGAVHHKVCHGTAFGVVAEVVHEGIAKELRVAGGAGQVTGRDDEVGIAVVNLNRNTG